MKNSHHKSLLPALTASPEDPFASIAAAADRRTLKQAVDTLITGEHPEQEKALADIQRSIKTTTKGQRGSKSSKKEVIEQRLQALMAYVGTSAPENGFYLQLCVHPSDANFVKSMRNRLIEENRITSLAESMVLDMVINSYFRSLHCWKWYNNLVVEADGKANLDWENINRMKEIGKQADLANRQFYAALAFLKELKQPPLTVKIHTKEAFVAQNQQFNKNA